MNCYTRKEKIQMAIEEITAKVKMVVEITVIVAGVVALGIIGIMNSKITTLEKELETYKYVQDQGLRLLFFFFAQALQGI